MENLDSEMKSMVSKRKKQPFRLSVNVPSAVGKSVLPFAYPYKCVQPCCDKIFSRNQFDKNVTEEDLMKLFEKHITGPREKYSRPVLESHNVVMRTNVACLPPDETCIPGGVARENVNGLTHRI